MLFCSNKNSVSKVFKHAQIMNYDNVFGSSDQSEVGVGCAGETMIEKAIEGFLFTF